MAIFSRTPAEAEQGQTSQPSTQPQPASAFTPPSLDLPKGGGAIRSIGEKFAVSPVTGTGSMTVPLATPPGRMGFGPQLALAYDSGAGNGPFGFGWTLALPAITRKTDKGLPQYRDDQGSDVFLIGGAEDLVPTLDGDGTPFEDTTIAPGYTIHRFRPRIESAFARIERWTGAGDDIHWRSISRDNVLTLYGASADTRIADPADSRRIFSWLICETRDDKGNAIVYEYKRENGDNVDLAQAHQRNRGLADDQGRRANRYPKRIRYGNRTPLLDAASQRPRSLTAAQIENAGWMFEIVFDYGEHNANAPTPTDAGTWQARADAFSSYRAGFELRTARLCQRVLAFHHFADEPEVGLDCLVGSTDFEYSHEQDPTSPRNPVYTFLQTARQVGYKRRNGGYERRGLPPVTFAYTLPVVQEIVEEVDSASLENLPSGLYGSAYQWIDLHGEGVPGILSDQAQGWFYKRNLGPLVDKPTFAPLEIVASKPNIALAGGQFLDLAGDGQPDLVVFDGVLPGLYEHDEDESWQPFRPFAARPNRDMRDPNLRFVDLDGDSHADMFVSEGHGFVWHPGRGEQGFGPARRAAFALDEEQGPRWVATNDTDAIHFADMSGDGLADIVRIRNGDVCYWPNLGYGRFGTKIAMDNAPLFDNPDQFDHKRIRLADIDGSGTTDIVYLHRDGVRLCFNQSGNGWSTPHTLAVFPHVDDLVNITTIDLLGNGTACLVWSSPLPSDTGRAMRYVNLMGPHKPHLLERSSNNLGAETRIAYASSTRFYLQDKRDGKPWLAKLPFPVHVVERVETYDRVSRNRFVSRYAYHHGYFDGEEREFRGFGMVEQWDTEEIGSIAADQDGSADTNLDMASFVPPLQTKTWFHTGVYLARDRVSSALAGQGNPAQPGEYFREPGWSQTDALAHLLPDTPLPPDLTIDEERDACRALKGAMLRQEIYGLDGTDVASTPYTVTEQNFTVVRLQPQASNRHATFFTHARETLSYHYERDADDPRIGHVLTLDVDNFGNVLRSLAVGYGRRVGRSTLAGEDRDKQERLLVTYTETAYTEPDPGMPLLWREAHRTPLPCEVRTYHLTGLAPAAGAVRLSFDALVANNFATLAGLPAVSYELPAAPDTAGKRLIERVRTVYRRDDLQGMVTFGRHQPRALSGESYKLAFTPGLLDLAYMRSAQPLLPTPSDVLAGSGTDRGGYVDLLGDDHWWIPSGQVFYSGDAGDTAAAEAAFARLHFFLPHRYRDPFGSSTSITYDSDDANPQRNHNLIALRTEDAVGNIVAALADYRVLQPRQITDPNGNRSAAAFDALGMVVGTAVMGKTTAVPAEGDSFAAFVPDLSSAQIAAYFDAADPRPLAPTLLGSATTRIVYDLDRVPVCAVTIARETHASELGAGMTPAVQLTFSYSDGFGREIQKKVQAEDGPVPRRSADGAIVVDANGQPMMTLADVSPRWVGSGWTIFNNKGKPIRQFEQFFSDTQRIDADTRIGVSPWLFYDPATRVVATLYPNHTYEKVAFGAWQHTTSDVNDTVLNADGSTDPLLDPGVKGFFSRVPAAEYAPTWYAERIALAAGDPERIAAQQAALHSQTPTVAHLDALGRPFLTVAHNRFRRAAATVEEHYITRTEIDIESNQRTIRDAIAQNGDTRGRLVMRYDYDMLGNRVHQASMDVGEHWTLSDAAGKQIRVWDSRNHDRRLSYDALRRPTALFVRENGGERLAERTVYGETEGDAGNHRARVYQTFDDAGIVTSLAYDFKGNLLAGRRDLLQGYRQRVDWQTNPQANGGGFTTTTRYDALNRARLVTTPDGSVYRPSFNSAGLLDIVDVNLRGSQQNNQPVWTPIVANINYDAKSQRTAISYGNGTQTTYRYEPRTFRLSGLRTVRPPTPDATATQIFADAAVVQDLRLSYDAAGNITRITDDALQTIFFANQQVAPVCAYTYDALYRLIEATGREHRGQTTHVVVPPNGNRRDVDYSGLADLVAHPNDLQAMRNFTEGYEFDAVGNLLSLRHTADGGTWTRGYQYAAASLTEPAKQNNRLTRTTVGNGANIVDVYSYADAQGRDVHGCMTAINGSAMAWDFKNQLEHVDRGGGGVAYYVYDAAGQRVRKVLEDQNGVVRSERIYLGGFELYREFGANPLSRETLHLTDGTQRIAIVETAIAPVVAAPLVRYQLGNHLGSATVELDNSGALIAYEEYHPFGTSSFQAGRSAAEVSLKRYRYTGKERDEETGFSYHGARYYAPWLGRWISADPAGLVDGPNLYRYARNNPIKLNDPSGMDPPRPNAAPVQVTPLIGDVSPTGVSGTFQFHDLFSSDRSVSGQGIVGARARGSFLFNIPALSLSTTGVGDASATAAVDTDLGRAGVSLQGGVLLGDRSGLNFVATGEGQLRIPVPARIGLNSVTQTFLSALPNAEGNVRINGALSAGTFQLGSFGANATLSDGRFQGSLKASTFGDIGRLRLDAAGRVGADGNVTLDSAQLRATVDVPGLNLTATGTGTGNADGSLSIRANANLRLFGLPSLQAEGTGSVSSSGASLSGTFRGAGPLYTSYITGNFDVSTQRGASASAGVFGLTYTPGVSVTDPSPPTPGMRAIAGEPRTPWSPGGLTVGASFFQYSQGNVNYISGGFIPDLSENILTNPRVGVSAQWHF